MDFDQLNITRKTEPIKLKGFHIKSINSFFEELIKSKTKPPWVFADLTLGAWRSFQVPYEFSVQLGMVNSIFSTERTEKQERISLSENFGKYVDKETSGDFTILKSLEITNRMVSQIRKNKSPTFIIFAPMFGFKWGIENIMFIQFLYYSLSDFSDMLIVSTDPDKVEIPKNWQIKWNKITSGQAQHKSNIAHLIPGIVSPESRKKITRPSDGILTLNNGFSIITPECRKNPSEISRSEWIEFESRFCEEKWLKPYLTFYSDSHRLADMDIFETIRRLLDEGSGSIALKIIEKVCSKEIPDELKIILQTFLQGIRIAYGEFEKLDGLQIPVSAPPEYESFLLMSKGWGRVMTDNPVGAESYFSQARDLLQGLPEHEHQLLWLLNISALNRFKMGDTDNALEMEKTIEEKHRMFRKKDWQLEYINSINMARIYRRKNESALSKKYFVRAFDTAKAVSSESDHLYRNFCLARHDFESQKLWNSLNGWIRIGLHWSSLNAPEAISKRVANAIINKRINDDENLVEKVSSAIHKKIIEMLHILKFDKTISHLESLDSRISSPVFARPNPRTGKINSEYAYEAFLGHQWSIIADSNIRNPVILNESYEKLRNLLYGLIKEVYANKSLNNLQSIIVDDQLGYEIPSNVKQLLETCLRLDVKKITAGDTTVNIESKQTELEETLVIKFRECVESIKIEKDFLAVEFKRYLPKKTISDEAGLVIKAVNNKSLSVKDLQRDLDVPHRKLMGILRDLEKMKIIYLGIDKLYQKELQDLEAQDIKMFS